MIADRVAFRDLSREEIETIISRNNVGRIAFAFHDRVDIQPIHYFYEHGCLSGRVQTDSLSHRRQRFARARGETQAAGRVNCTLVP